MTGYSPKKAISPSASGVAYLRSIHEDISGDHLAKYFVTPEGEALARKWLVELPCVGKEVSLRCRWFDSEIKLAIDSGVHQVVQIAAGLSTFPWRCPVSVNIRYAEFDRTEMIQFKKRAVAELVEAGHIVIPKYCIDWRSIDLASSNLEPTFRSLPWDFNSPSLFVLEGISYYLSQKRLAALIGEIYKIVPKMSRLILDYFHDQTEDLPPLERVMGSIALSGGEAAWRRIRQGEINSLFQKWRIITNESLAEKAKRDGIGQLMDYVSVLSAMKIE